MLIMMVTPQWQETVIGMQDALFQLGRNVTEAELQPFLLGEVHNGDSLQVRKMTYAELADWFIAWDAAWKNTLATNA